MLDGLDHFDDACDACCCLGVGDVGFDGAEVEGCVGVAVLAVGGHEGLGFDGVAEGVPVPWASTASNSVAVSPALARAWAMTRRCEGPLGAVRPLEAPSWLMAEPADDGEYAVAVAEGFGEALEDECTDTFGRTETVRLLGERLAPPIGGQATQLGELHERRRGRHDRRTAGQGEGALARAQPLYGQVQGYQGGRTRGVHGDRRSLQPQHVRHPARRDANRVALAQIALVACRGPLHQAAAVVGTGHTEVDAVLGAGQGARVDAGPLQCLPRHLQQQPLLRVHRGRLARTDAEECGVESGSVVDEAAFPYVQLPFDADLGCSTPGSIPGPRAGPETTSRPPVTRSHNCAGEVTPPG